MGTLNGKANGTVNGKVNDAVNGKMNLDTDAVRIGVIGAGRMGKNHCRVVAGLRRATLAGVCDQNVQMGVAVARQHEAPFFASVDELLEKVDAVTIAVPTPHHFAIASRCLEKGVHVFVEKPITATVEEADRLAALAEASGLVMQVGHIERFNPTYSELKNVLADMTPLAINFRRLSPYVGSNTDVDVVLDLMIHDLDLMGDLLHGAPAQIDASGVTAFSGSLDHVIACLRSTAGPLVTVTASRLTEQKVRQIEVTTLEAYVVADLLNKSISVHRSMTGEYVNHAPRGVKYRQESVVESIHVPMAEPLLLEMQHFLECVRTGALPLVTATQGADALRLAMQIRETAHAHLLSLATVHHVVPAPQELKETA
jgi:predicted dehydrogenase